MGQAQLFVIKLTLTFAFVPHILMDLKYKMFQNKKNEKNLSQSREYHSVSLYPLSLPLPSLPLSLPISLPLSLPEKNSLEIFESRIVWTSGKNVWMSRKEK